MVEIPFSIIVAIIKTSQNFIPFIFLSAERNIAVFRIESVIGKIVNISEESKSLISFSASFGVNGENTPPNCLVRTT